MEVTSSPDGCVTENAFVGAESMLSESEINALLAYTSNECLTCEILKKLKRRLVKAEKVLKWYADGKYWDKKYYNYIGYKAQKYLEDIKNDS